MDHLMSRESIYAVVQAVCALSLCAGVFILWGLGVMLTTLGLVGGVCALTFEVLDSRYASNLTSPSTTRKDSA